jgi:hypothetical protein
MVDEVRIFSFGTAQRRKIEIFVCDEKRWTEEEGHASK